MESFDSALQPESKMLGFRQPTEFPRGAFDGKMEAHFGPDEVHGIVTEGADASLLGLLEQAISLCHS